MVWTFWRNPLHILIAGVIVNGLALLLAMIVPDILIPLRIGLIVTGFLLAVIGVNHRLRSFSEAMEQRSTTASYMALAAFVLVLGHLASAAEWDTWRLVLAVFVAVALVGAILVLLPLLVRRLTIIVLVLFHFGGILTAIFSVAPPNGINCWLTGAMWTYIYRPYLQFMYLNNAYHFYSPEPGPATQLWFLVSYDDPNVKPRWFVVPRREDYASKLPYYRRIAMTESTTYQRLGLPEDFYGGGGRLDRRNKVILDIPYWSDLPQEKRIFAPPDTSQYREPRDLDAKKYIASYARHVATNPEYRSNDSPDTPIKSVKVYRVMHTILQPGELAERQEPNAANRFVPVYMGEFDRDGNLRDPTDPMLYWVVPILVDKTPGGGFVIRDYVKVHAHTDSSPATDQQ